jgi:serine/threonine-protein kinase
MQLQSEAKRPSEINPGLPIGLEQITMRAMRKKPRDRYQSAAEMILDLEEFKRNPSIRFEYSHFVDNEPTKYVESGEKVTHKTSDNATSEVDDEDEDKEAEERQKVIPIITGIAVGLVTLSVIIMAILYFLGVFSNNDKVEVPQFIGKNYYIEIEKNDEYKDFTFTTVEEQSSDKEPGTVIKQEPSKGEKIKRGETITLTIAVGNETAVIPDVSKMSFEEAKSKLINEGFTNIAGAQYEYSSTVDKDKVIRTEPASASEVNVSTQITIYLATDDNSGSLVKVPSLMGWSLADANAMLESANLVLSSNVTVEDSDRPKDEVIWQSLNPDDSVPAGTAISVVVSSGVPASSSATITLKLPNQGSGVDGVLKVYIDNVIVDSVSNVTILLNGKKHSFTVSGSGSGKTLQAYIDGILVYECKIDFRKSPAKISNVKTYEYSSDNDEKPVPYVVNETEANAKQILKDAGFNNVIVQRTFTDVASKVGTVINQTPEYNEDMPYDTSTMVTLFIGTSSSGEEE